MKTCSKCGVSKEGAEFSSRRLDCKECCQVNYRAYYIKNREEIAAHQKAYRAENREEIAAYQKVRRAENREDIATKAKAYYIKNRKVLAAKAKAYHIKNRKEIAAKAKARRTKNREEHNIHKKESRYGLTTGDFKRMLTEQCGVCAICSGIGDKLGLCIDHDHTTKEVRRLICRTCNLALGYLKDSSKVARAAMKYLENYGK